MATQKQRAAARSNVKEAQAGEARKLNIEGRSKMGRNELQRAVARAR